MTVSAEDIKRIIAQCRPLLDRWAERERRPRVACKSCQFEYVRADGKKCSCDE